MMKTPTVDVAQSALLIVDVQCGFSELCPGELPVPGALAIVPRINQLLSMNWKRIDASLDWHPADHCSFHGQRDNLYPPHCVINTKGAEFLPGLKTDRIQCAWRKGFQADFEAYAVTAQHPGMVDLYRSEGVKTVVICGLAINICCFFAARDFRQAGFEVVIVEDASAGIDVPAAGLFQATTKQEAIKHGIQYVQTADFASPRQR